ncbi:MAG: DUF1295 domain-containing protein [Bdellovibrionales bacterium]
MPDFVFGFSPFLAGAAAALLFFHIVWIFAYFKKRNDYVDVAWGPGFGIVAWAAFDWTCITQYRATVDFRTLLVCTLVTVLGP